MKQSMQRFGKFVKDVRQELKYVSWPSKDDIKEGTIVVISMSLLTSLFLFLVDQIFSNIVRVIL